MSIYDEVYILSDSFHINKFSILIGDDEASQALLAEFKDNVLMLPDDSIAGIKMEVADKHLDDKEVEAYRFNLKKMPAAMKAENLDDVYKILCAFIPLDETV